MRTKEAIRNTSISTITYIFIVIIGFFSQKIFKDVLGAEYLGLHGLFSNIMTMLAIAELGFGTAIISNMYKPVAENDTKKILSLLQFYKKIYHILAIIILVIGIILLPFINSIVGVNQLNINFKIVFMFYLFDTAFSYCLTYKRSILYAYQKTYYTNIVHAISVIIMNILQIIALLFTKNYYLYLTLRILFRLIENVIINIIANKLYPYIKERKKYSLEKSIIRDIKRKIKGLIFHKIGSFVVLGSDNIIISTLPNLGLKYVGLYSNYSMIINQLNALINQIFNSLTSGIGNLLVENNDKKTYNTFKKIMFFNGWIYIYISISFYMVSKPFIALWMGKEYLLDEITLIILTVNFFIQGMRAAFGSFKDAAGIFYEDRFVPLIECIVNVSVSVVLGNYLGLAGIFIGTICSNMVIYSYSFPKLIYIKILKSNIKTYIIDLFWWILNFICIMTFSVIASNFIKIDNGILSLIINIVVSFVLSNSLLFLFNKNKSELSYLKNIILKIIKKYNIFNINHKENI